MQTGSSDLCATTLAKKAHHLQLKVEQSLGKLCELRDIAPDLERNVRYSWLMILAPNIACIAGVFTLGFGIGASVLTNNVAALAALANGLLPMRKVAQIEAERRHMLEMELRQGGLLREGGSTELGADLVPLAALPASDNAAAPHSYQVRTRRRRLTEPRTLPLLGWAKLDPDALVASTSGGIPRANAGGSE